MTTQSDSSILESSESRIETQLKWDCAAIIAFSSIEILVRFRDSQLNPEWKIGSIFMHVNV